jgi:hypothetical protein
VWSLFAAKCLLNARDDLSLEAAPKISKHRRARRLAFERTIFIGHQDVPKDTRLFRIFRDDFQKSMKRTSSLREIDSACHVRWNDGSLAARLRNRIYLDCECHGNAHLPECVGECDCLRSTPAVPIDNDSRFPLFARRESPSPSESSIRTTLMKSLPSMVVFERYSFCERVAMAKVGCELHLRVLRIVLADKASNKPNNDRLPAHWRAWAARNGHSRSRLARRPVRAKIAVPKPKPTF